MWRPAKTARRRLVQATTTRQIGPELLDPREGIASNRSAKPKVVPIPTNSFPDRRCFLKQSKPPMNIETPPNWTRNDMIPASTANSVRPPLDSSAKRIAQQLVTRDG